MSKRLYWVLLLVFLLEFPAASQNLMQSSTESKLRDAGFSDNILTKLKRNAKPPGKPILSFPPPQVIISTSFDPDSFDSENPSTESSTSTDQPSSGGSTSPAPTPESLPTPAEGAVEITSPSTLPQQKTTKSSDKQKSSTKKYKAKKEKKTGGIKKKTTTKSKKSSGKKYAPVVQSTPEQPLLPSPQIAIPPYGMGQEIYSQEPLNLPPISQLPQPSRTTLPPVSQAGMMELSLSETVTRVLACNFMGLTGLNQTTSADVSREGSFKMGFHTSWFTLERVYDRVLASGESGKFFSAPLFFNYAVTNDLEFALHLPIWDYTVKSRILWPADFRESGLGDTKLSFKYRVFDNPQYQMRGAFGLGFKFPTGNSDKGLGTGKTDFEVFTAFSKNFEKIIAHLHLGYIMTGDPNTAYYPDGLADIFYYNIGLEYPHTNNVTVMAEVNGEDWGAEGLKIDVTPSLRYTPTENFAFDVGVPISVTNDQRYGYNYKITFGVCAFFK